MPSPSTRMRGRVSNVASIEHRCQAACRVSSLSPTVQGRLLNAKLMAHVARPGAERRGYRLLTKAGYRTFDSVGMWQGRISRVLGFATEKRPPAIVRLVQVETLRSCVMRSDHIVGDTGSCVCASGRRRIVHVDLGISVTSSLTPVAPCSHEEGLSCRPVDWVSSCLLTTLTQPSDMFRMWLKKREGRLTP